jgi:hypothetical protein
VCVCVCEGKRECVCEREREGLRVTVPSGLRVCERERTKGGESPCPVAMPPAVSLLFARAMRPPAPLACRVLSVEG